MTTEKLAVCPGSFDPVTLGHIDIINRASKLFDRVIVLVSINAAKTYSFTTAERVKMLETVTKGIPNVEIKSRHKKYPLHLL